ncbi:YscQ/HrcQ family type III secretion apparatus protein [Pseudomonas aeruginosa]|nr:YscQ/HrcQ family type III secretion apparatus protein [Pseudomonas aeruginosa]
MQTPGDRLLARMLASSGSRPLPLADLARLLDAVQGRIQVASAAESHAARLQVRLPQLGAVEVQVLHGHGQLQIEISASPGSLALLQQARGELLERLQRLHPEQPVQLDLPLASRAELDLQRRLARCRRHYVGNALQARLDIAQAAPDVDLELSLAWDGLPLRFLCQAPALARWLAPNLQEAAFASLPAALQLALLEREGNVFPGLVWYGLSPAQPRAAMGLRLSLERDDQRLALWLDGDPATLLARLPPRPSAQRLAIPLRLSLQWPGLPLDAGELRTLEPGDLLLLPAGHRPDAALLGVLEGRPWARCQLHSTQLELLDMHDTPSLADSEDLHELDQLPIPVSFEVGRRTLDLHTLSTLQPGSLLDLDCALDGEVRILANQRCLGIGELVRLQDRLGVRVTRLFGHDEA